jgi:hypothetical protein
MERLKTGVLHNRVCDVLAWGRTVRHFYEIFSASTKFSHYLREQGLHATLFVPFLLPQWQKITEFDDQKVVESGLLKTVSLFTTLWRTYDDYIDDQHDQGRIVSREEALRCSVDKRSASEIERELLKSINEADLSDERSQAVLQAVRNFQNLAFDPHNQLIIKPGDTKSFEEILNLRYQTVGLLGTTYARICNAFSGEKGEGAAKIERALEIAGVVGQFSDDLLDWHKDEGLRYNLFTSVLEMFPEETVEARRQVQGQEIFNRLELLKQSAPQALSEYNRLVLREIDQFPEDLKLTDLRLFTEDMFFRVSTLWIVLTGNEKLLKATAGLRDFITT